MQQSLRFQHGCSETLNRGGVCRGVVSGRTPAESFLVEQYFLVVASWHFRGVGKAHDESLRHRSLRQQLCRERYP